MRPFPFRPLSSNKYAVGFEWTCPSLTDSPFHLCKIGKRRNSILLCCVKGIFWVKGVSVSSTFSFKTSRNLLELKLNIKAALTLDIHISPRPRQPGDSIFLFPFSLSSTEHKQWHGRVYQRESEQTPAENSPDAYRRGSGSFREMKSKGQL